MSSPASPAVALPALVSLFCGCGGLDLGFVNAGFEVALALDKSEDAIASYRLNFPGDHAATADLANIGADEITALLEGKKLKNVGVIGGPPCQYYSRGNVAPKPEDIRRVLPLRFATIVRELDDTIGVSFFLFENVKNLDSLRHKDALDEIKAALSDKFWLHQQVLDSADFEVPQFRQRFFLVGFKKTLFPQLGYEFPRASNLPPPTVRDRISGFPEPTYSSPTQFVEPNAFHANHWTMKPKSKWFDSGVDPTNNSARRSFRVLDWDRPSWTVAYGNREVHIHPDGHRRLTIYEALRLQGFPEVFTLSGGFSGQVTQVSNAVPPPLAHALALAIKTFIELNITRRTRRLKGDQRRVGSHS